MRMSQTLPCSSSWNRPRFGLLRRSYIPCNFYPNLLIHMESNRHADSHLFAPTPFFSTGRVLCEFFEGHRSLIWEKEYAPLCQPQKSPVFPSELSSWAYHNHQPGQDFVYGVYTPYAKLPGRGNGWLCLWKPAQPAVMRYQPRSPVVIIVTERRRKVPPPKTIMQFHR